VKKAMSYIAAAVTPSMVEPLDMNSITSVVKLLIPGQWIDHFSGEVLIKRTN
jgi:hypothetical protein